MCQQTNLHLVLQHLHVSLFHQFVKRHKLSKALSHSHDLGLSGQVKRQLQSRVEPHLLYTARQMSGKHPAALFSFLAYCVLGSKHNFSGYILKFLALEQRVGKKQCMWNV